jgi:asparagine synthetase B (glutamine-hydrolysing)
VIIYKDDKKFNIMHDALGQKEIYYCKNQNKIICGSQPNLIAKYSSPKLGFTKDKDVLKYYKNDLKKVRVGRLWVGDETYFQDVKHLMPNHYLDINSMTVERYWPNKRLERIELEDASKQLSDYLKGAIRAVTARNKVMVAVTAGFDSRSVLAASKSVRKKVYYFVNKEPRLSEKSRDLIISKKIFEMIKEPFNIHEVSTQVDEEFKKIYFENVFLATDLIMPANYSVYFKKHQDKVNLSATGELGREYYSEAPRELDAYYLARSLKYKTSAYAVAKCDKWFNEVRDLVKKNNVDIMKLLFWEFVMGNWEALAHSEADISIEQFDIYDSHYVCEIMLSVGPVGDNLLKRTIGRMWPELLEFPFNPPESYREKIKYYLKKTGSYKYLQRILYGYDHRIFNIFYRKAF